jgi:hypothetical protein
VRWGSVPPEEEWLLLSQCHGLAARSYGCLRLGIRWVRVVGRASAAGLRIGSGPQALRTKGLVAEVQALRSPVG